MTEDEHTTNAKTNGMNTRKATTKKTNSNANANANARKDARRGLKLALVWVGAAYVTWVLLGTVAWVSHLGERAPALAFALPARGFPANDASASAFEFLARNAPLSLIFVVPHSCALPSRLYGIVGVYGRLAYNVLSAAMLHLFLWAFTPLKTPVVMTIPFNENFHVCLSVGCLAYASYAFMSSTETLGLLGVSTALGMRDAKYKNPSPGMDAITWMGVTTWRLGGAFAFVLFTGVSIIPQRLTLGDCITRCIAAVYLRQRSRSFREWVEKIEHVHLLTWCVRAFLLSSACYSIWRGGGDARTVFWIFAGAGTLAGILRLAESTRSDAVKIAEKASHAIKSSVVVRDRDDNAPAPASLSERVDDDDRADDQGAQAWRAWTPLPRKSTSVVAPAVVA